MLFFNFSKKYFWDQEENSKMIGYVLQEKTTHIYIFSMHYLHYYCVSIKPWKKAQDGKPSKSTTLKKNVHNKSQHL